jgi:alkylation response protein AidB-like acyl-CoA dehydrogenase
VDIGDSPEEAAFRAEARAWLEAHAPRRSGDRPAGGPPDEAEAVQRAKDWQATLYDAGWAGITWPKEHGGRGGTPMHQAIFEQELGRFDVSSGLFAVGIAMAGPTIMGHGTEAQKERFLSPMLRGDEVWCQLFSEPGAGSDLASLATRAVRDGDRWVVDGQKVWTSSAHVSDWAILLARTDPDLPKHKGITFFLLDMRTPGVDVRPLRQVTGVAHFNEVFLTDVEVPAENVVGPVNEGWRTAMTTLMNERTFIGGATRDDLAAGLVAEARARGRTGDPLVCQRLAEVYVVQQLIRYLGLRVQTALSQETPLGPETSVLKLASSLQRARVDDLAMDLLGADGTLFDYAVVDEASWQQHFLFQWASRIGGGTEQVQRNIIGERLLGLPREPRPS